MLNKTAVLVDTDDGEAPFTRFDVLDVNRDDRLSSAESAAQHFWQMSTKPAAKTRRSLRRIVLALLCCVPVAATVAQSIHSSDELPPRPPPTEAQLQRGRELLEKIAYVIQNVPITDAPAVLKVFGFNESVQQEYPTNVYVVPKGPTEDASADMQGSGFEDLSVNPWIGNPRHTIVAWLSGRIARSEACLTVADVRRVLEPISASVASERILDIHPIQRPPPLNDIGHLFFTQVRTPFSPLAGASFLFEYQACAQRFGFTYHKPTPETPK